MKKKYLPIKLKDIKRYMGYYWEWYKTYDKDCYKYVIEQLHCDYKFNLDKYYNDLISSIHTVIKGGKFHKIEK